MIVGVQKAATTSLFEILSNHSSITPSLRKEIHYFDDDEWYFKKSSINEYHGFFPLPYCVPKGNILFEATPLYIYHPEVAQRLFKYNPELKLIILLRDPAYRALSAWAMYHYTFKDGEYSHLHDARTFKEAIEQELNKIDDINYYTNKIGYVKRGIYHYQIENYFNYFKKNKVLILESSDLNNNFKNTLKLIHDFLEIPYEPLAQISANIGVDDVVKGHEKEIKTLKSFYKPYNLLLFELLGKDYKWNEICL